MRYLPLTPEDRTEMLARIGVGSIDDLFVGVPRDKALRKLPDLPLTKSEIEAACDEIRLKSSMGGAFAKAMSGKKDELIKLLLKVGSFTYEGKVPRSMRYSAE